jgi:hypothetical protein
VFHELAFVLKALVWAFSFPPLQSLFGSESNIPSSS